MRISTDEISIYRGKAASRKTIVDAATRIKSAFPKMPKLTVDLLLRMFAEKQFTDKRVIDAVDFVIVNFSGYGLYPHLSEFLSYDRKIKKYTYKEICEIATPANPTDELFEMIKTDDDIFWVDKKNKKFFGYLENRTRL